MKSLTAQARQAGALYFVLMLMGIGGEFLVPRFLVPGNASATLANIAQAEQMYRFNIFLGLASGILFIFVTASLYRLFKDVDRHQAMLMTLLIMTGIAVSLANSSLRFAPLMILNSPETIEVFTKPQLDRLAAGSLKLSTLGSSIPMAFWGIWLFPFGLLVIKSGFLPKILGICLLTAGFAYMVSSAVSILAPSYTSALTPFLMPLYFGEVPIILWLLMKGATVKTAINQ